MAGLVANGANGMGRDLLSRSAVLRLREHGLTDPLELLRHDTFVKIIEALKPLGLPDLDSVVRDFRDAVRAYRRDQRKNFWQTVIDRAPNNVRAILQDMPDARGKRFEGKVEALLDVVGIAYKRLDDGKIPGAADLHVGLSDLVQIVIELKTAEGEGAVGLNDATDVIKGAAIVDLSHLPKVTLANPGFDPNVPWQARNAKELALIEACQFAYGISLLARDEIDRNMFLDWLAQPGVTPIPMSRPS